MSNRDWSDLLDGGWPAAEPPRGFADGVLARLAAPAPVQLHIVREAPPRAWRSTLVCAALAVAAFVIVPLALHRHATPAHASNVARSVAVGVIPDLGLERD